jgi:uncharacterized membrane protein YkoI
MTSLAPRALLGCGGLALALLVVHGIMPVAGPERTSAQELLKRPQQIQGQLEPGGAEPAQQQGARADELIRQIEAIEQQSLASAPAPEPALGEEEARRLVRDGLGVEVLSAELVERDGRPVYALTVMNPPGDYNGAMMVRTLLVDGATGGLLGEVPDAPRTASEQGSGLSRAAGLEGSGPEARRRTYR